MSEIDDILKELNSCKYDLRLYEEIFQTQKYEINIYQKKYYYMWIYLGISHGLLIVLSLLYWGIL